MDIDFIEPEINTQMSKKEARNAHRKAMAMKGIRIGCHTVVSAKHTNRIKYALEGTCMTCKKVSHLCKCDDRSAWAKARA